MVNPLVTRRMMDLPAVNPILVPVISVLIDYLIHKIYLETLEVPPGANPYGGTMFPIEGLEYYGSKFMIVAATYLFITIYAIQKGRVGFDLSRIIFTGLVGSTLFGIYYAFTRPLIPIDLALQIFLIHTFAITVAVLFVETLIPIRRR